MTSDDLSDPSLRLALKLPQASAGQRIGLFGGSFDPPHDGHLMVSRAAIRRLRLDQLWWLVTPGNPLKEHAPGALARRVEAARQLARGEPKIRVTAVEAALGTRFTAETLAILKARRPGVRFVWIMGADNLRQFHRWRQWREIASMMPIAVLDRPGSTYAATVSATATALAPYRIGEDRAGALAGLDPPAWIFLHGRRTALSSTALRAAGKTRDESS
ncbi:nicotinic acid mononucleotide adenylyltransferase [Kaistia algarum]|uniref:nicotinate-nucleotide adenylyltransferase n=1 Tax=Kaistia algarum TaxID=2083279 RepID=UPI000CE73982|nr:nicotinic acid mononucleotide adenylyltransferase [Kaistia algarum]